MTKIFIEAKHNKTSEYHFLHTILNIFFPNKEVEFVFMDGIGNLFNEVIINQIKLAKEMGEKVIVIVDADTKAKGTGYEKRKKEIEEGMTTHNVAFPYFLYPNNQDDGDVEVLMEKAARRDLHSTFFDCFEDYEKCVSSEKDESGNSKYNVPNLKGKLHTYITAQKLSGKSAKGLGSGNWLFDNKDFWDIDIEALRPLKEFFKDNL